MLTRKPDAQMEFDFAKVVEASKDNPVFYLQYAHARISNIINHGKSLGHELSESFYPELLSHNSEIDLLKKLDQFPMIMDTAMELLEPQGIANYLQSLASAFHKFYVDCRVITKDKKISQARLALISATQVVLRNGLNILGITAPKRM